MVKDLISILMPFKNEERYLEDCIDSILAQNYVNWELIAIDDHSTDISGDIIKRHAQSDFRIRYFKNHKEGIINALKCGFNEAKGEYIHRMDADDVMPPNKLQTLYRTLEKDGRGTVATGMVKYFGEKGISKGYLEYERWLNSLCENENHRDNIFRECVIASPAWLIHRNDLEKIGAFESDLYPEDYDLVFRMYESGLKFISTNEVIHYWREHSERISRNSKNYNQESFFRLKVHYFLRIHYQVEKELLILGSGIKGKLVHKILNEKNIDNLWLTDKKIDLEKLKLSSQTSQIIILFSDSRSQKLVETYLQKKGMKENRDYFFFR